MPTLRTDLKVDETLRFSGEGQVAITLLHKSGQRARLKVDADDSVTIHTPGETASHDVVKTGLSQRNAM